MASAEREPITGVWRRSDPTDSPTPTPVKNSSDLYQFQERPLAKVGWKCPPQSTEPDARQAISSYNSWRTMASRYCVVVIGGTACSRGDVIPPRLSLSVASTKLTMLEMAKPGCLQHIDQLHLLLVQGNGASQTPPPSPLSRWSCLDACPRHSSTR